MFALEKNRVWLHMAKYCISNIALDLKLYYFSLRSIVMCANMLFILLTCGVCCVTVCLQVYVCLHFSAGTVLQCINWIADYALSCTE